MLDISLPLGAKVLLKRTGSSAWDERRVVRYVPVGKEYYFAKWLTAYKGAITCTVVAEDCMEATDGKEIRVVYSAPKGGIVLDRYLEYSTIPWPGAVKRRMERDFKEFEAVLES